MTNKNLVAVIVIILIALAGVAVLIGEPQNMPVQNEEFSPAATAAPTGTARTKWEVEITDAGYRPAQLEIKRGDSVTWANKGSRSNWPASDAHPTHTGYPGSSIEKCGTGESRNIFDACKPLGSGESYTFVFDEFGEWRYHDHTAPGLAGTIIVGR